MGKSIAINKSHDVVYYTAPSWRCLIELKIKEEKQQNSVGFYESERKADVRIQDIGFDSFT